MNVVSTRTGPCWTLPWQLQNRLLENGSESPCCTPASRRPPPDCVALPAIGWCCASWANLDWPFHIPYRSFFIPAGVRCKTFAARPNRTSWLYGRWRKAYSWDPIMEDWSLFNPARGTSWCSRGAGWGADSRQQGKRATQAIMGGLVFRTTTRAGTERRGETDQEQKKKKKKTKSFANPCVRPRGFEVKKREKGQK